MPKGCYPRPTVAERLMRHSIEEPNTGCWIWLGYRTQEGYGQIELWDADAQKGYPVPAHRVAFEEWIGPLDPRMFACHRCDNPPCINPKHLFAGTNADNMQDMVKKGRGNKPRGERHGRAHITPEVVLAVRTALASGKYQRVIAEEFGIAQSHVARIKSGKTWRHLFNG